MRAAGLPVPLSRFVRAAGEVAVAAREVGFPALVRASRTLGGAGGGVARDLAELEAAVAHGLRQSPVGEVLVERLANFVFFSQGFSQIEQSGDEFIVVEIFFRFILLKDLAQVVEPYVDGLDGCFWATIFKRRQGCGLSAMKEHKWSVLLVRERPLIVV